MRQKNIIPASIRSTIKKLIRKNKLSISQAGQDLWVYSEVFNEKKNGFFLDIGSHDGLAISNTYLLEKRYKWTGICIEANNVTFSKLIKNRNAVCLNVCVDDTERDVQFYNSGSHSGIVDKGLDNDGISDSKNTVKLKTLPLIQILNEHNAPSIIDYLSIDVEGAEERILGNFDFDAYTFRCITIERPSEKLMNILDQNNYVLVRKIPDLDCFYVHKSFIKEYYKNIFKYYKKVQFKIYF